MKVNTIEFFTANTTKNSITSTVTVCFHSISNCVNAVVIGIRICTNEVSVSVTLIFVDYKLIIGLGTPVSVDIDMSKTL